MKTIIKYIYIIITLSLIASCSKESNNLNTEKDLNLEIKMKSNIGNISDNVTYNTVRVIAARQSNGLIVYNNLFSNSGDQISANLISDTYNIYVIVNEKASLNLGSLTTESSINNVIINYDPAEVINESTIMCYSKTAGVILKKDNTGNATVSTDNGNTWNSILNVNIARVYSKLSLAVRKQTANAADQFTITGVTLKQIPTFSYLSPQIFTNPGTQSKVLFTGSQAFTGANSSTYTSVTMNNIIPEYLTSSTNVNSLMYLQISANYQIPSGSIFPITYNIPILGYTPSDFNTYRNNHYVIRVTVIDRTNVNYLPYLQIDVANWDNADKIISDIDIGNDIRVYNWYWETGTQIDPDGSVRVAANSGVKLYFTLSSPKGSTWLANLTNPVDFTFDTSTGGVTSGIADNGTLHYIIIKPIKPVTTNNVITNFYITINNGVTIKPISFNGKYSFAIKQIPS